MGILGTTRSWLVNGGRGFALAAALLPQRAPVPTGLQAGETSATLQRFLVAESADHAYRARRCLTAGIGSRHGWLSASTTLDPDRGFSYRVTAEGGSGFIRSRVLHQLLEAERKLAADRARDTAAFSRANYQFQMQDRDEDGLLHVRILPRRKDRLLIDGMLVLRPATGEPVLVKGRLAKSPSFWVKSVDIVTRYAPIAGVVLPVSLESSAQLRFFGSGKLTVRHSYAEVDGRSVRPTPTLSSCGSEPQVSARPKTLVPSADDRRPQSSEPVSPERLPA